LPLPLKIFAPDNWIGCNLVCAWESTSGFSPRRFFTHHRVRQGQGSDHRAQWSVKVFHLIPSLHRQRHKRHIFARLAAACLFWLAAMTAVGALPVIEMRDTCFFAGPDDPALPVPDCGYVVVPQSPDAPTGPQVRLGFMRLNARTADPKAPLFMLAGGPGDTLMKPEFLMLFADGFLGPVLNDRDVVILEQRGGLNSLPVLDCPGFYGFPWAAHEQGLDLQQQLEASRRLLRACVASARSAGVDLAQYTSLHSAQDVDLARQVLGYQRIVYYGGSYGAQLGQHFMRDYPESLEAVILDGASPLSRRSWVQDRVRDVDTATDKLAALCAADGKCARAYDVRAMIAAAMELFTAGPITTVYADPVDPGIKIDLTLTREDLAALIFSYQTGQIAIRSLPAILNALVEEGPNSAAAILGSVKGAAIVASRGQTTGGMAMLMHMAVVCSDDPVRSVSDLNIEPGASAYAIAYGRSVLDQYMEFCKAVDVPVLPDSVHADVTSNVPTLILAGSLDARTPVFRSGIVARSLPQARMVVFPEGTHVQLGEVNFCAGKILLAFMSDPEKAVDTSCIADMPRRGFVLPDGTNSIE
jgi:pimeloyl-ACP methyl ester carboxylesterase